MASGTHVSDGAAPDSGGSDVRANGQQPTTLSDLLGSLGTGVMSLVPPTTRLQETVTDIVIAEISDPVGLTAGAFVLGVGSPATSTDLQRFIKLATDAGCTAVGVKAEPDALDALCASTPPESPAVVSVLDGVNWGHLFGLLSSAANPDIARSGSFSEFPRTGGLFSVADAIASMCGGSVMIEDMQRRVLAFSNSDGQELDDARRAAILARRAAPDLHDMFRADELVQRLSSGEIVDIEPGRYPGVSERRVIAARVGERPVATVWLQGGARSEPAQRALRAGASVVALHLARSQVDRSVEARVRRQLLGSILQGRAPSGSATRELGVDPAEPMAVAAFRAVSANDEDDAIAASMMLSSVAIHRRALRLNAAAMELGGTLYILLNTDRELDRHGHHMPFGLEELHASLAELVGAPVTGGVGRQVGGVGEVVASRRDADLTIRALRSRGRHAELADIAGVEASARLLALGDLFAEDQRLDPSLLARLRSLDADDGGHYEETARAYLDQNCNGRAAARELDIHPNTFRYRLDRLLERAGIDLKDPEQRFLLELELRLLP